MSIISYKPRLQLRVVWHSEFFAGRDLARQLYSQLCRDSEKPASRGLGIPVYYHVGQTPAEAGLPSSLRLDEAESTVVVALVDTAVRSDEAWIEALRSIEETVAVPQNRSGHLLLPVACESKVLNVLKKTNFVRLDAVRPENQSSALVSKVTHELARLLLGSNRDVKSEDFGRLERSFAPVKLFISHSKHGREGVLIATELRDHIHKHLPLATFFDSNDIAAGRDFEKEIIASVADSAMVIVHTDTYSDRAWCRKEVLLAKQYGCPVLVVNALAGVYKLQRAFGRQMSGLNDLGLASAYDLREVV